MCCSWLRQLPPAGECKRSAAQTPPSAPFVDYLSNTMNLKSIAVSLSLAAFAMASHAQQAPASQQPPNPEQMKQLMQATFGAMVSVMGPMTEAIIEAQLNEASKPETATRLAAFKRNLFQALLKQGFNEQQALQITIATAAPSATPSNK